MRNRWLITGVGIALVTSLLAWQPAASPKGAFSNSDFILADIDLAEIARTLVNQSARVKEGEFVHINGGTRDLELLEDLAIATRRLGAWPLVTLSSDRMTRLMYDDVPRLQRERSSPRRGVPQAHRRTGRGRPTGGGSGP